MTSGPAASSSRESDTTGSTPPKSTVGQRNVARPRRHGTMATSTRHGEAAMDDEPENLNWPRFGEAFSELEKAVADNGCVAVLCSSITRVGRILDGLLLSAHSASSL